MQRSLDILVVDDDPVSLAHVRSLIVQLGGGVVCVGDVGAARRALASRPFDLVLCDLRLPDGGGASLLDSTSEGLVFIAMSAHVLPAVARGLRRKGFAAVIEKPLSIAALQSIFARHFGGRVQKVAEPAQVQYRVVPSQVRSGVLDDDAARVACGSDDIVLALRKLFAEELSRTRVHIRQALRTRRYAMAREALHKLAASCGLVGAAPLRAATVALMAAIDGGEPDRGLVLVFDRVAGRTQVELGAFR